jgi:hypothetical protein
MSLRLVAVGAELDWLFKFGMAERLMLSFLSLKEVPVFSALVVGHCNIERFCKNNYQRPKG